MNLSEPTPYMKAIASIRSLMDTDEAILSTVLEYHILNLTTELDDLVEGRIEEAQSAKDMQEYFERFRDSATKSFRDDLESYGFEEEILLILEKDFSSSVTMSYNMMKQAAKFHKQEVMN